MARPTALVGNPTDVVFQAAADIAQAGGTLTLTATTSSIDIAAVAGGAADGATGEYDRASFFQRAQPTAATYDAGTNTLSD